MARKQPGLERIEAALLCILKQKPLSEITVTELCENAQVSRSTFYAHFPNVDAVYRSSVSGLLFNTASLKNQMECKECINSKKLPLCSIIRDAPEYQGLVNDRRFLPTFLEICKDGFPEDTLNVYLEACKDIEIARVLLGFQLAGCIISAQNGHPDTNWGKIRTAIDAFIRGGLNAIRKN